MGTVSPSCLCFDKAPFLVKPGAQTGTRMSAHLSQDRDAASGGGRSTLGREWGLPQGWAPGSCEVLKGELCSEQSNGARPGDSPELESVPQSTFDMIFKVFDNSTPLRVMK